MRELLRVRLLITIVFLLCISTPAWSMALTTFGKSNPQNQNQPTPPPTPVGKARECTSESNCAAIRNTSCMVDPKDSNTRCLCGDYSAPINGACTNKIQAVGAPCNLDSDCGEAAHCTYGNNTLPGKRCYCKTGYYEENQMCNGASSLLRLSTFTFLAMLIMSQSTGRP
ncbi:uncharacterized protein LOC117174152 [Belonocnema kinseyi]|uniref:uncharacterized protein LOC117174152 n=1 Tax=Belonocnema kinseyi TaxID=2817044 RepID=UPI00143E0A5D|nr:uncharacterized protein LOC117174152 [Belonocnema kinseyi]